MHFTLAALAVVAFVILTAAAPRPALERTGVAIPITEHYSCLDLDKAVEFDVPNSDINSYIASSEANILPDFVNHGNNGTSQSCAAEWAEKRADGVPLSYSRLIWYGTVSVGDPPRPFDVFFDTTSFGLTLPGTDCETCYGHALWDPALSSSSENWYEPRSISYGDGAFVDCVIYADAISIAGLIAPHQEICVATFYSEKFQSPMFPADGMMGLDIESLSDPRSFLQTLVAQQQVPEQVISLKLSSPRAELYVGGSNPALYSGEFTYVPVIPDEGYPWKVLMNHVIGDNRLVAGNAFAIIDTAERLVRGDPSQVFALHRYLGGRHVGRGYFSYPCNRIPTFIFTFDDIDVEIPPSIVNIGTYPDNPSLCKTAIVAHADNHSRLWFMGGVFLKNVYIRLDVGNSQIGFAQLAPQL